MPRALTDVTYVLPIPRTAAVDRDELAASLDALCALVPVIVVDGSPAELFARHAEACDTAAITATDRLLGGALRQRPLHCESATRCSRRGLLLN